MFRGILRKGPPNRPAPKDIVKKWKIVRGDTVQIITGKDAKKKGVITKVLRDRNRVIVEGLNLVKKHVKSTEKSKGGIVSKEAPIHVSNVALIDPVSGKPTRVRWGFLAEGQKNLGEMNDRGRVRIAKKSGAIIPKPATLTHTRKTKPTDTAKDTPPNIVHMQTYTPPVVEAPVLESISVSRRKDWKYVRKVLEVRAKAKQRAENAPTAPDAAVPSETPPSPSSSSQSAA